MQPESTPKSHGDAPLRSVLLPAFERLGFPILLFGIVFFFVTLLVTLVLTPDRFPVRIGDRVVRLIDLEQEQKKLLVEKVDLEGKRDSSIDTRAPVLHQLGVLRSRIVPVGTVLLAIDDVRLRFKTARVDPISLPQISVSPSSPSSASGVTIKIGGEVRDGGGKTMQTLASFVDGLRAIPSVLSVSEPEYAEKTDPDGTTVSPFSISLTLIHAAP